MHSTALVPLWLIRSTEMTSAAKVQFAEGRLHSPTVPAEPETVVMPRWLVEHPTLSNDAKVVYVVCADRLAQRDGDGWPHNLDEVVKASGLASEQALKALRDLKDAGFIVDPTSQQA